jgi:hypothetical protein
MSRAIKTNTDDWHYSTNPNEEMNCVGENPSGVLAELMATIGIGKFNDSSSSRAKSVMEGHSITIGS